MTIETQEEFYGILDKYNGGIEPLESWNTPDLVALIRTLDAELQRRSDLEGELRSALQGEVFHDDFPEDYEVG